MKMSVLKLPSFVFPAVDASCVTNVNLRGCRPLAASHLNDGLARIASQDAKASP